MACSSLFCIDSSVSDPLLIILPFNSSIDGGRIKISTDSDRILLPEKHRSSQSQELHHIRLPAIPKPAPSAFRNSYQRMCCIRSRLLPEAFKFFPGNKEVVHSLLFTFSGRAGGHGHGKPGVTFHEGKISLHIVPFPTPDGPDITNSFPSFITLLSSLKYPTLAKYFTMFFYLHQQKNMADYDLL